MISATPPTRGARRCAGALATALALALGVTACSSDDESPQAESAAQEAGQTRTVEKTRVQVVEGLGGEGGDGRFDPAGIYKRLSPGVVTVISIFEGGLRSLDREGSGGLGSGFVVDDKGFVVTNAHVISDGEGAGRKRAREVYVEFSDGNRVPARIVGDDGNADVALLKLNPAGLSLTPIELGDSAGLEVGQPVAAIGSPFGERQSLSVGVISALDRDIESLTAFRIGNAIQTDAAINRGNSGGPLLDAGGRVIGINQQIKSTSGGGEGVGFAVPVSAVSRSIDQLRRAGKVEYGFLGVTSQEIYPQLARRLGIDTTAGALVAEVEDGSPADRAGLAPGREKIRFQAQEDIPRGGDVIVGVDGKKLDETNNLGDLIGFKRAGEKVRLEVLKGDERRTVTVTLGQRPNRAPERRPAP